MAIVVSLDLNEPVSVRDLWQFLALVPQGYDPDRDLRSTDARNIAIRSLDIYLSGPDSGTPPPGHAPPAGAQKP